MTSRLRIRSTCMGALVFWLGSISATAQESHSKWLSWEPLPDVPGTLGVAGPFAGSTPEGADTAVVLIAGGANFPIPEGATGLFDDRTQKVYHRSVHALIREGGGFAWRADVGQLPRSIAYGASACTPHGVLCAGGQDGERAYADAFLLNWDAATETLIQQELPDLPEPSVGGSAVWSSGAVWLWTGQTDLGADSASRHLWRLDMDGLSSGTPAAELTWTAQPDLPAHGRTMAQMAVQHDGYDDSIYLIGGRYADPSQEASRAAALGLAFLDEVWQFKTSGAEEPTWRPRAPSPVPLTAGSALSFGQSHVFVLGYATGETLADAARAGGGAPDWQKYSHPGFPRNALAYHTITDSWTEAGPLPLNQVTTPALRFGDELLVISGETAPRIRTRGGWRFTVRPHARSFATLDYVIVGLYLLGMIGIGLWFMRRNKDTNQYFRGGKGIPWWAAGCSIYATMLSSLTFTGLPAKSFAQDWAYIGGTFMIVAAAPIAVFVALPFFRKLDVTSAYEYLEKRFNRSVRQFGSACFTIFHVFRMGIVMSLTALALAVCTPLSPEESVLLIGLLSIAYCAMGGIEAVIWTDTIQTVVLFGGAVVALIYMLASSDGNLMEAAQSHDKLRVMNWNLDVTRSDVAIWVILVGGLFQNVSSYTADQAVVQRYMTTPSQEMAARSIWTNAAMVVPGALLFYALGTALFLFYRSHGSELDPTITTDQIFPLFIGTQLPVGLAGLMIASVFAAAQSTVSTSMNSVSTTIVTDFIRPAGAGRSEASYLRWARATTVIAGVLGTLVGWFFIDPSFKSLFDQFLKVIGMFMGILGGLFMLGVLTRRASGAGALIGALSGVGVMIYLWMATAVHPALYPCLGVSSCVVIGWLVSWILPRDPHSLDGLTIYTKRDALGAMDA